MFRNAQKWFRIANLLNSVSEEPLLGLALSMLKLGQIEKCLEVIENRPSIG